MIRFLPLLLLAAVPAASAASHVVVIGIDGLSPDGVRKAETPVLHRMMLEGSFTLHARGVIPTVSSPNWASMISGAGPEQHGVTSNEWQPGKAEIPPVATSAPGYFPTMFYQVRRERPSAGIAIFHDWKDFARLVEPGVPTVIEHHKGPEATTSAAIRYFSERKPLLTFIHLDHVDHAGHDKGHGSKDYYAAVAEADRLIGEVLTAIEKAGIAADTTVIVTADHGGVGTKHGGMTMAELEIPFIAVGNGVPKGKEIKQPVNVYDLAATVVKMLGVPPHPAWVAKPAF